MLQTNINDHIQQEGPRAMTSKTHTAPETAMRPIVEVARELGIADDELELYGKYKAKIDLGVLRRLKGAPSGKLIYVTAITATPAGEGKTVTAIGLSQALGRLNKRVCVCLREPSMGPAFGIKGGAAGGGMARLVPSDEINLHFTGDIHAVGAANNLLAALIDNHIHHGNRLGIDPRRIVWKRVLDVNDRSLRNVVIGLGGPGSGVPREAGFDNTVASELMAILCLAQDLQDLRDRLGRMLVAYTYDQKPVYVRDLAAHGALTAVLKDAIKPNLVQTLEGDPAFVHGGPFANIAHGNNSALATKTALKLSDYVVTEGGFATDLGAEKFFDIVHGYTGLTPDVAVLVCSVRSLHMHGGVEKGSEAEANVEALRRGLANLDHHVGILRKFGLPAVVAINRFPTDSGEEIECILRHCADLGVRAAVSEVVAKGGVGGIELANAVLDALAHEASDFRPLYDWNLPLKEKISVLATEVYGADGVDFTPQAEAELTRLTELGFGALPICMAKTQHSLSDNPKLKGAPKGWRLLIREVRGSLGAGFIVCIAGEMMTMPGLPKEPAAERIDVDPDGTIRNLR